MISSIKSDSPLTRRGFLEKSALNETVLLGNMAAHFAGRPGNRRLPDDRQPPGPLVIEWDAEHYRITNSEAANRRLTKNHRSGWDVSAA